MATFAKRARDAAITAGATLEAAEATSEAAASDAETTIADAMAMQEWTIATKTKQKRWSETTSGGGTPQNTIDRGTAGGHE